MSLLSKVHQKLNESITTLHNVDGGLLSSFSDSQHDFEIMKGNKFEKRFNISRKLGKDTTLSTVLVNTSKSALNHISSNIFSETIGCIVLFEIGNSENKQIASFAKSSDQLELYNITLNISMLRNYFGVTEFAPIEKKIERLLLQQIPNREIDYLFVKNKTEQQIYTTINYIVKTIEKQKNVDCYFLMVQKDIMDQEKVLKNLKNSEGLINASDTLSQGDYRDFVNKVKGALGTSQGELPMHILIDGFKYTQSDQGESGKLYTIDYKNAKYKKLFAEFLVQAETISHDETLTDRDLKQKISAIQKDMLPPSFFDVSFRNEKVFKVEVV